MVGGGFYLKGAKWKGCRPFCIQRTALCKVAKAGAWSEGGHGVYSHGSTGRGGETGDGHRKGKQAGATRSLGRKGKAAEAGDKRPLPSL